MNKPATVELSMMGKKFEFSRKQHAEIKRRLARGELFHPIARKMCVPYEALRRQYDEAYRLERNERVRCRREGIERRFGKGFPPRTEPTVETPSFVLEERTRRLALSRSTLTAEFFGDPLPGYSALDRRPRP